MESKEPNSKEKKKKNAAPRPRKAKQRRTPNIERQATGWEGKRKTMFDTRPQNEEGKIRTRKSKGWHEKKKRKMRYIAHCINFMSFSVAFKLHGSRPIEFNCEKKLKSYDKARKFNCTC